MQTVLKWLEVILRRKPNTKLERQALGVNNYEDRCIGTLMGVACGDILGSQVEGRTCSEIQTWYRRVRDFPLGGCYTDDTEMTLALATSPVECQKLDPAHVAASYVRYFTAVPKRAYGPDCMRILSALRDGADYRITVSGKGRAIYASGCGLVNWEDES